MNLQNIPKKTLNALCIQHVPVQTDAAYYMICGCMMLYGYINVAERLQIRSQSRVTFIQFWASLWTCLSLDVKDLGRFPTRQERSEDQRL